MRYFWPSSSLHKTSQEYPVTSNPGGRLSTAFKTSIKSPNLVRIRRWSGHEALSTTHTGRSVGHFLSYSNGRISTIFPSDIKNTTVLFDWKAGKSGNFPFFPVPVQTKTWSETSLWVVGTVATTGATSADVRPGITTGL
ncbi:hypothetical protein OGATHE_000634 [Ogataea polymorpha]|uniref:Uncharacterized protein n=1 Tax=Ogataea polymorpha TaxID=460523 RepID=A0A9P8PV67_9ASCO|nr:hypothetical protein OGATHE_000634 [Ogataea polymorpha]